MTDRPQTPAEKGQRMNAYPSLLRKLLVRRNRFDGDEENA